MGFQQDEAVAMVEVRSVVQELGEAHTVGKGNCTVGDLVVLVHRMAAFE